jgi:hypothetical protein
MESGAPVSIQVLPERGTLRNGERLVPIAVASDRLGRSVWTLKRRMFPRGLLPVVISEGKWLVYESFIEAVLVAPRPGEARRIEDVAAQWFAARASAALA